MGNYALETKMLKRRKKKMKENTYIMIQEFTLDPMSSVEGGSADDRVLSQMMLNHYWSGSAGGPHGWPVVIVTEFSSMNDLLVEDLSKLLKSCWLDEKERKAFQDRHRAYWGHYVHEDIGIYVNNVKQQKSTKI